MIRKNITCYIGPYISAVPPSHGSPVVTTTKNTTGNGITAASTAVSTGACFDKTESVSYLAYFGFYLLVRFFFTLCLFTSTVVVTDVVLHFFPFSVLTTCTYFFTCQCQYSDTSGFTTRNDCAHLNQHTCAIL